MGAREQSLCTIVWLALLLLCAPTYNSAEEPVASSGAQQPRPVPSLAPADVVSIQLDALKRNDASDSGIEIAFRFASPANKRSTGPLPRFARMIKEGPYALMLEFRQVAYEPVEIVADKAHQRVTLISARQTTTYVFYLTRQRDGEFANCWMTDAVMIEPFAGRQA